MLRICFIPFDPEHQHEFVASSSQWNSEGVNLRNAKNFTVIAYDGTVNNSLSTLSSDSTIYIRGHGGQGGTEFSTNARVNDENVRAQSLSIAAVCQRLMDTGLQKSFAGKIKFSNCWSGVADPSRNGRETPSALRGAKYFRDKGYKKCRIYGYMGPVSSEIGPPENPDINIIHPSLNDGYHHKTVILPGQGDSRQTMTRAKLARQEFLPPPPPQKSLLDRAIEFFTPGTG